MINLKLIMVLILCVLLFSLFFGSCKDKSSPTKPKEEFIKDIVNFIVGKTLDQLNIKHKLFTRWK